MIFTVTNQAVTIDKKDLAVKGTIGIYDCEFSFDSSWDGFARTAVFKNSNVSTLYEMVLPESNVCTVPHEVLAVEG